MIRIEIPVDVARPVQEVFAYVTDLERLGEWQPNVVSVTKQTKTKRMHKAIQRLNGLMASITRCLA